MTPLDWAIVALYCVIVIIVGVVLTKKASGGIVDYFASGHKLGWFLVGTSMVATTFSSDTPLFVTKLVRQRGIWGNWEWWCFGISHMLAVFFFARMWKRAGVLTEVELAELRYSGRSASLLRGFKAIYWGVLYNIVLIGGMPITGLAKVMESTTPWDKTTAVLFCMGVSTFYGIFSGLWGVVVNDVFQFALAMIGAIILAIYAVGAAGGVGNIVHNLAPSGTLDFVPAAGGDFWTSSFTWLLALMCMQWWAYKNSDGGGVLVQRFVAAKDEKQALYGTLWFNIANYALRSWPWILTALASLILIPKISDPEMAYPQLITQVLPVGLRGLLIASFFAAFMSTVDAYMNWGASYVTNDVYKRFVKPNESERHYVRFSRFVSVLIMALATWYALQAESVEKTFTQILNFTAGIGVVNLARWFWWRVNAWSEMVAMVASIPAVLLQTRAALWLGVISNAEQTSILFNILFMIGFTALFWVPATLLTKPVDEKRLGEFYRRVRPFGFGWSRFRDFADGGSQSPRWQRSIALWLVGVGFLFALTFSLGKLVLGFYNEAVIAGLIGGACLLMMVRLLKKELVK